MVWIGKGWDIPPEQDTIGDFRWWKLGGGKVLRLVVVSHEAVPYKGHYVNRRMVPCLGDGCKWCAQKIGTQIRFVIAAAEATTQQVGLLEVGRSVGLELRDMSKRHGQLRGMCFCLSRISYSKQSRMEVEYEERDTPGWVFELRAPDIRKALECTWRRQGVPDEDTVEPEPEGGRKPWDRPCPG